MPGLTHTPGTVHTVSGGSGMMGHNLPSFAHMRQLSTLRCYDTVGIEYLQYSSI